VKFIKRLWAVIEKGKKHSFCNGLEYSIKVFRGFLFYYSYKLYKYNKNPFCILIDRKIEFNIDPDAKIIIKNGASLHIGTWEHPNVIPGRCNVKIKIDGSGVLKVNGNFKIGRGCCIHIYDAAIFEVNSGILNGNDNIYCADKIQIGNHFMASWNVDVMDSDGHPIFFNPTEGKPKSKTAPIIIGDDCWIGHNVIILKGANISDGAIIGAGSVVTRDVPDHTIVAGNPIEVIRRNAYWL